MVGGCSVYVNVFNLIDAECLGGRGDDIFDILIGSVRDGIDACQVYWMVKEKRSSAALSRTEHVPCARPPDLAGRLR